MPKNRPTYYEYFSYGFPMILNRIPKGRSKHGHAVEIPEELEPSGGWHVEGDVHLVEPEHYEAGVLHWKTGPKTECIGPKRGRILPKIR